VLWYLRSSESLLVRFKPASLTVLYHEEAFRVSKNVNLRELFRLGLKYHSPSSNSSAVMHVGVAHNTERNQVLLRIIAVLAAKFFVVNLKI
jgi:hypothetical protein